MRHFYTRALALILAALFACASGWYLYAHRTQIVVLDPAGPVALAERTVIFKTLLLCSIVVVPVFIMLFYFAWRYRAGHPQVHKSHHPEWDHSDGILESVWWFVPGIIIAILSVITWQSSHALDPYKPLPGDTMTIQVVALDWKWLFIYPAEGIATVNLVEFPAGVPVRFEITSDAPMNSFWIPQLGGQIMAMPGMTTQLNLEADRTGDFSGFSANISGMGFAGMTFTARAVSPLDFDVWVQRVQSGSHPLDAESYRSLAAPSEYNGVATYAPVEDNLYTNVVMDYMMPMGAAQPAMPGMHMPTTPAPSSSSTNMTESMGGMTMPMQEATTP